MPETSLSRRTFCSLVAAAARPDGTPIRAAFLGTGHAHALAKILALRSRPEFELAGICQPDADGPGEGEVLQGVRWLSLDELLKDSSIQLVSGGISRPAQPQIRQAVSRRGQVRSPRQSSGRRSAG